MEANWYQSIAGIVAASIFVGAGVRRWLSDVEGPNAVPLVVYVLLSCLGLTFLAHSVMGAFHDRNIWQLLVDACTACVISVGTVSMASNVHKPLKSTAEDARTSRLLRGPGRFGRLAVTVAVLGVAASGCATRGGVAVSPEGTIALRANQLVQALRTVTAPDGPVDQLVAQKVLTPPRALQVAVTLRETFVYAEDLAKVLKVVDESRTEAERTAGLQKAQALVNAISRKLNEVTLSPETEPARRAVAAILQAASAILLTVGSIFPAVG